MIDETESIRRERIAEIAAEPGTREALEAKYGQVWNTDELRNDFEVIGFMAPLVVVKRKADRQKGSLEFRTGPERFYFNVRTAQAVARKFAVPIGLSAHRRARTTTLRLGQA